MSSKPTLTLTGLTIGLLTIFLFLSTCLLYIEHYKTPLLFPNRNNIDPIAAPEDYIWDQLNTFGLKDTNIKQALPAYQEILSFRYAKRRKTTISLIRLRFESGKIKNGEALKRALTGNQAVLLASPNEKYNCDPNPTSAYSLICNNCGLAGLDNGTTRLIGKVQGHPCNGAYTNYGISWVANAVVVPNYDSLMQKLRDHTLAKIPIFGNKLRPGVLFNSQLDSFLTRLRESRTSNLQLAIADLFNHINLKKEAWPQSIIVPAIGSGNGIISKRDFYSIFFEELLKKASDSGYIPEHILLMMDPMESPEKILSTGQALHVQLTTLINKFGGRDVRNKILLDFYCTLIGIITCVLLLAIAFAAGKLTLPPTHEAIVKTHIHIIAFIFILSAMGLTAGYFKLVSFIPFEGVLDYFYKIAAGFIAAGVYFGMYRLGPTFKQLKENKPKVDVH